MKAIIHSQSIEKRDSQLIGFSMASYTKDCQEAYEEPLPQHNSTSIHENNQ